MMDKQVAESTLRVYATPADINRNGHIFGGWILSQMDVAGGIAAGRLANGPVATVAIKDMEFHQPMLLGDLLSIYTTVTNVGTSSITIHIEVLAERHRRPERFKITDGSFVFVAIDAQGRPRPVYEEEP